MHDDGPEGWVGNLDPAVASQVLDAAPDAMIVCAPDETFVMVNAQTEAMFGYTRAEMLGASLELLLPESVRGRHHGYVTRYLNSPQPRPMGSGLELQGRHKDGRLIPVEVSLGPVRSAGRTLVCAAIRDVTSRKRIEMAAKLNAERLASAVESIDDALALYDADGRLVLCNSAYRALTTALPGALIGMRFEDVFGALLPKLEPLGAAEEQALLDPRRAEQKGRRSSLDVRTLDGHSLRVMTRRTTEGGFVQTVWDLTNDVRREQELREARSAAEAASSAKSEFLSSMSHELRTPLNAVLGFAQLLERDKKAPLPERHRERVAHILKGGEHLLRLIDEVLDLARIETGRVPMSPEPVALSQVLGEVETTLEAMATRAEVELLIEPLPAHLPEVIADRMRFKQILLNFGSNAIKYGRRGGRVIFRASLEDGLLRVTVADDGQGIPAEKQDKLFQPFYRAGQETGAIEGTGIGLALTKRLAQLMDGRVGFRSAVGVGSEFWVELPARRLGDRAPVEGIEPAQSLLSNLFSTSGPRHLVVYIEDNPSNIELMQDLLGDFERVDLVTAPTAEIGIEIVRARQPGVVIMDINLPGMSGLEAVRRLQAWPETAAIPVIGLSAAATERDLQRAREHGFHTYLTKPVDLDELARALSALLAPEGDAG